MVCFDEVRCFGGLTRDFAEVFSKRKMEELKIKAIGAGIGF